MQADLTSRPGRAAWSLADIRYDTIPCERIRADRDLFYLVTSASFVEITSDLYTRNLVDYFERDPAVVRWLTEEWEPEELQHGAALRRYVETVWPDFDWGRAYQDFLADYTRHPTATGFAASRSLELAGRCVVETGTASFYRMLADSSPEPVLAQIARHIAADEVRHYKNFYRFFRQYAAREVPGGPHILWALGSKAFDIRSRNAFFAFKHAYLGINGDGRPFRRNDYARFRAGIRRRARRHFPHGMAVRMILKPLGLGDRTSRVVTSVATFAVRRLTCS
jgi:hypothetical protein